MQDPQFDSIINNNVLTIQNTHSTERNILRNIELKNRKKQNWGGGIDYYGKFVWDDRGGTGIIRMKRTSPTRRLSATMKHILQRNTRMEVVKRVKNGWIDIRNTMR